jgi:hypothetical protein
MLGLVVPGMYYSFGSLVSLLTGDVGTALTVTKLLKSHTLVSVTCCLEYVAYSNNASTAIQGRDCLIQKFRNSSVMLEAPEFRPKVITCLSFWLCIRRAMCVWADNG